jgi:hypothetical protein
MALRFFDGFDGYATADITKRWNATTGAHTIQTGGRFGANVLRVASGGGGDWQYKYLDGQQFWYIGFAFKFLGTPSGGGLWTFFQLRSLSTVQIELGLDASNRLCAQRGGVALSGCTGTTTLSAGNWYYCELAVKITSSTAAGDIKGYLGGIQEFSCNSGVNTNTAASGVADRIALGSSWPNNTNHLSWDDLYVCDGTGSRNNGVLGDMRVETILPDGAGNYQQFALTGAASSQAAVNENPNNGDTSYVSSFTPGQYETFTFGNLVSAPKSIAGIQLTTVCRKDDAGTRIISPVYRISSSDYVSPGQAVLDSYAFAIDIQELNPATSAVWTATTVNALEAGIKLVS